MTGRKSAPEIKVGIVSGAGLTVTFNGGFSVFDDDALVEGRWTAYHSDGTIILSKEGEIPLAGKEMVFSPESKDSSFTLHSVTIGVNFHWQRDEDQTFRGKLKFIIEHGKITAINVLSLEEYLISVISSEMSATSSKELLKAHAVISRSWLLAQIEKNRKLVRSTATYQNYFRTENEITRWYDREDHKNYDVCADDHCQRYQGITRASTKIVEDVIHETFGEVLLYNDEICDARFSKCCGGITERFENTWEPVEHPYLTNFADSAGVHDGNSSDVGDEHDAEEWIRGNPDAFCNTQDAEVLRQVLNDYDQETHDFYRWKVDYTQEELSVLVNEKTGVDFGTITSLVPLSRGTSGRIIRLRIEGTKKTMDIGKELEIRKALSKSHLYSSAFVVDKISEGQDVRFRLTGAGWGHGVGLCQIGAAVMGARGYSYKEILQHYFRGALLKKRY